MDHRAFTLLAGLALAGGSMALAQDRPPNPLAPRAPFAGKFSGDGLTLELSGQGGGYTGTITFQGQVMPCRAQAQGEGLAGSFSAGGSEFPFEAAPDGQGGLRLASGGKTYALRPDGPRNPLVGGGPAAGPGPGPAAGELTGEAKHPLGVAVKLPSGWSTMELQGNVLLVPPGANPQDPNCGEFHFLLAEAADPSIRSPGDPRVVQHMDQVIGQSFPLLRRSAEPKTVDTPAGPTSVMEWSGTAPNGQPMRGRAYVAIVGQNGAAVFSVGLSSLMDPRDATMKVVAASMKAFQSEANPRLVGKWGNNGGWAIAGNHGRGGAHGSSRVEMTLGPGGQLHEFELRYVQTPAGIVESKEERHGTWTANAATLTLRYQSGESATYRYQLTGEGLMCTAANGGQVLWQPSR